MGGALADGLALAGLALAGLEWARPGWATAWAGAVEVLGLAVPGFATADVAARSAGAAGEVVEPAECEAGGDWAWLLPPLDLSTQAVITTSTTTVASSTRRRRR